VADSLAGTWTGDVTYTQAVAPNPSGAFVQPTTVTFGADYQPATAVVFFGVAHQVCQVPAGNLRNPGDQQVAAFTVGGSSTATITATVTSISQSSTAFSIDLDLQIVCTGSVQGTVSSTYHWDASIQPGDQLSWSQTNPVVLANPSTTIDITSTGTLCRL
jgi:hypothetical protein